MKRFILLDKSNFEKYKHHIVANEKYFTPRKRSAKVEYDKIIEDNSSVTLLLFNHNFVGYVAGYDEGDSCFYIFSLLIVPKFRRKGYGRALFNRLLREVVKRGFKGLSGHFNERSIKLLPKDRVVMSKKWYKGYKYVRVSC